MTLEWELETDSRATFSTLIIASVFSVLALILSIILGFCAQGEYLTSLPGVLYIVVMAYLASHILCLAVVWIGYGTHQFKHGGRLLLVSSNLICCNISIMSLIIKCESPALMFSAATAASILTMAEATVLYFVPVSYFTCCSGGEEVVCEDTSDDGLTGSVEVDHTINSDSTEEVGL